MIARTARWLIRNPELKVRSTYNHRLRIAPAFLACHRSTLFRQQAQEIHKFPLQVQEHSSHSSLRSTDFQIKASQQKAFILHTLYEI